MSHRKFASDHYIELLRGYRRPSPHYMRKVLAVRAAWLTRKIETRILGREPYDLYLDELAVIAAVTELIPTKDEGSEGDAHGL